MNKTFKLVAAILFMAGGLLIMLPILVDGRMPTFLTFLYVSLCIATGVLLLVIKKDTRFSIIPVALYYTMIVIMSLVRDSFYIWYLFAFLGAVTFVLAGFIKPARLVLAIVAMALVSVFVVRNVIVDLRGMEFAFDYGYGFDYICYILRDLSFLGAFTLFGIGLITMNAAEKKSAQPNYAYAGYNGYAAPQNSYAAPQNYYAAPQNGYAAPAQPLPTQPVRPAQPVQPVAPAAGFSDNSAELLMRYKKLLDAGIITQEEFDAKKKQILGL